MQMTVSDVLDRIERMNRILDQYDIHEQFTPGHFDDIITFLEEYRDMLLSKKVS